MDKFPVELWTRIFDLACLDDGSTARSLSAVSRYIRKISENIRYRSIALLGRHEILKFADSLKDVTPELRRIRYLFISSHDPRRPQDLHLALFLRYRDALSASEESEWSDRDEDEKSKVLEAIGSILEIAGPSLENLAIFTLWANGDDLSVPPAMPKLRDLALYGSGLNSLNYEGFESLPALKRLHFVDCCPFRRIAAIAPSLTHVRVCGMHGVHIIMLALSPDLDAPSITEQRAPLSSLLPHLQMLVIQPMSFQQPGTDLSSRLQAPTAAYARPSRWTAQDERIIVLDAPEQNSAWHERCMKSLTQWRERNEGAPGYWPVFDRKKDVVLP